MRFFRRIETAFPYHTAVRSLSSNLSFPVINSPSINCIVLPPNLGWLAVCPTQPTKKIWNKISKAIRSVSVDMPIFPSHKIIDDAYFVATPLHDVLLKLCELEKFLKENDPLFLSKIKTLSNHEELDFKIITETKERALYYGLQVYREYGIQHEAELPLKGLQKAGMLSQEQINEIRLVMLRIVNESRIQYEKMHGAISVTQPGEENIPYFFGQKF